jgi:flagellar hook-basal body complex protein FliE
MVAPVKPSPVPLAEFLSSAQRAGGSSSVGKSSGLGVGGSDAVGANESADFTAKLREALNEANATQANAETAAADFASGKQNDLHGTMITLAQADVSLRLVSNVRNRVIEAYREVMRMGS